MKGIYLYKWYRYHSCHYCIDALNQFTCIAKNTGYSLLQHGIPEYVCKVCVVSSYVYKLCFDSAFLLLMLSSYNLGIHLLDTHKQFCISDGL